MDIAFNLATESVSQLSRREALCVDPETPVRNVLKLLKDRGRGEVLVCRDRRLVGIFTERDALRLLADGEKLDAPVEHVMTRDPTTLEERDAIGTAVVRMAANGYRRLPIVDDEGKPVALVGVTGIVHWLVEHFPKAVYNLPPGSKRATQEREGP
ncbi:MAG: CBS domain-containing protein [Planctomycetota bacterium]|jgi:CBS domain-containing protein